MATCLHPSLRALFSVPLLALTAASCSPLQVRHERAADQNAHEASKIPPDVVVEVLREEARFPNKRSLTIRLSRKVSEDELALIAEELKARDLKEYERTFMCYLLPGMKVGAGAWASSNFEPELQVEILGIPATQSALADEVIPEGSTRIATWSDEVTGGLLTLLQSENGLVMWMQFKDKSVRTRELVESRIGRRRRLDSKEKSRSGDYYMVAENGVLEFWDSDGLIRTAAPMKEK